MPLSRYFTQYYGNWRTIAYQQSEDHLSGAQKSTAPFTLTDKDLVPAKPTGPLKDRVEK